MIIITRIIVTLAILNFRRRSLKQILQQFLKMEQELIRQISNYRPIATDSNKVYADETKNSSIHSNLLTQDDNVYILVIVDL